MINKKVIIILLVVLGVFLRLFLFAKVPSSLYWDEVAIILDAKSITESGQDMSGHHWWQALYISYGDYKLPIYIILTSFFVKLLPFTEYIVRIPSLIAGLMTILVPCLIAYRLFAVKHEFKFNFILALVFIAAICPWSIHFSHLGFESHLAQLLLAIAIYFSLSKKMTSVFLAQIFAILATYCYFSIRFIWLPLFIFQVIFFHDKKVNFKNIFLSLISLGIYLFSLLMMSRSALFKASEQLRLSTPSIMQMQEHVLLSNQYLELAGNNLVNKIIFHRYVFLIRSLINNFSKNLSLSFVFLFGDPNLRHSVSEYSLFYLSSLPFFILGLIHLIKNKFKVFCFLLFWILLAFLPASVPLEVPHAQRSLSALTPLIIIIGIGLLYLKRLTKLSKYKNIYQFILISLISLNLMSVFNFMNFYEHVYANTSQASFQSGYKELAKKIIEVKKDNKPIYVDFYDDRLFLWLFLEADFKSTDYRRIKYNGTFPQEIDNIKFEKFSVLKFTDNKNFYIVMKKSLLDSFPNIIDYELIQEFYIPNNFNSDTLVLIYVK